jgi:type VI secretion system protein ImpA
MTAARASVIDLEALLAPIAGENPAGENLQYAALHDEIRQARRKDDDLSQGEWKHELKVAEWDKVKELATEALARSTKDLQVGAWLSEALVKLSGFAGLLDGLSLMRGLEENFWECLYPEIDEGDLEARANALSWMETQLAMAIKEVPLTGSSRGTNYSFLQWQEARDFDIPENIDQLSGADYERASELKTRATEEGKVTGEDWRKAKDSTSRAFYEETHALLSECRQEFLSLERATDERFGRDAPGLGELKKTLDEICSLVEKLVREKRLLEPDPAMVEEKSAEDEPRPDAIRTVTTIDGPIGTRQEALRHLALVADFFRRTEPHSPVSYLVQRAIRWGEMPLETWLQDVIKDDTVLAHLRETLGLRSDGGGSAGW